MQLERYAKSQDVSWFLDLYNQGKLDLNPSYQRKSIWNIKDKEFFIDTVINNYPCPAVFLYKDIDENGCTTYRVIDGKQRLSAIIEYSLNEFAYSKEIGNEDLARKKFIDLDTNYKKCFWNYSIPIEQINTDNDDVIKSIFDRLNRNNKKLTPQELRNARYDGAIFQFIHNEAMDDFWCSYLSIGKKDRMRMEDEQFVSELVLLSLSEQIQGFNHDKLDKMYSDYDIVFDEEEILKEKFCQIKQYIKNLAESASGLNKYFMTRTNFYTLWSYILLNINALPTSEELAKILDNISNVVKLPAEELAAHPNYMEYYNGTKGASTDKKPREARYEALKLIIESYMDNEIQ